VTCGAFSAPAWLIDLHGTGAQPTPGNGGADM